GRRVLLAGPGEGHGCGGTVRARLARQQSGEGGGLGLGLEQEGRRRHRDVLRTGTVATASGRGLGARQPVTTRRQHTAQTTAATATRSMTCIQGWPLSLPT